MSNRVQKNFATWQKEGWIPDWRIQEGEKTWELIRTRGWTYWHHLFTPNSAGESCQTVLGNSPFAITEFGASLSKDCGGSESVQAQYVNDWMVLFKAQTQFKLGTQYAMADEAPGSGTGYGLRRKDLSHRPSWDTYKAQAIETTTAETTPSPPSNLRITEPL